MKTHQLCGVTATGRREMQRTRSARLWLHSPGCGA